MKLPDNIKLVGATAVKENVYIEAAGNLTKDGSKAILDVLKVDESIPEKRMNIIWKGPVFYPTGMATANREYITALKKRGHNIQVQDIWTDEYDFCEDKRDWNNAIGVDKDTINVFSGYPQFWVEKHGRPVGWFVHEGTRLHNGWKEMLNNCPLFVPSNPIKNMFKWNEVNPPTVIPHGVNEELYKPSGNFFDHSKDSNEFVFLSVNSWTGNQGDRKGTDLLIKAFDEEFTEKDDVKLLLKFGTFWAKPIDYQKKIMEILGHANDNIMWNDAYVPEKELVEYYQKADFFVAPTKAEGFGLTILNAMACGLPVIVTKNNNAGYMDFCKGKESVVWIESNDVEQGDRTFYAEGNMVAKIEIKDIRKSLRQAYNERKVLKEKAIEVSNVIRKDWSWDKAAEKLEEFLCLKNKN